MPVCACESRPVWLTVLPWLIMRVVIIACQAYTEDLLLLTCISMLVRSRPDKSSICPSLLCAQTDREKTQLLNNSSCYGAHDSFRELLHSAEVHVGIAAPEAALAPLVSRERRARHPVHYARHRPACQAAPLPCGAPSQEGSSWPWLCLRSLSVWHVIIHCTLAEAAPRRLLTCLTLTRDMPRRARISVQTEQPRS